MKLLSPIVIDEVISKEDKKTDYDRHSETRRRGTFEVNMKPRAYGNDELKYEDIASYKFFGIDAR